MNNHETYRHPPNSLEKWHARYMLFKKWKEGFCIFDKPCHTHHFLGTTEYERSPKTNAMHTACDAKSGSYMYTWSEIQNKCGVKGMTLMTLCICVVDIG